jgi:uncharacterized DUF497 family protein
VELTFEWDPKKAEANLAKHGVGFPEAATIFGAPLARTIYDNEHSDIEDRYVTIGYSEQNRLIVAGHTDREDRVRIITARPASTRERQEHEQRPRS